VVASLAKGRRKGTNRIVNEVKGVNRLVDDATLSGSKGLRTDEIPRESGEFVELCCAELKRVELAGHWPYTGGWSQTMPKSAAKPARGRTRSQRLEARVTAAQKTLIERAAALQGRTVTDFVLTSVQDAARRAINEHQQIELSVRDSQAFVDALLNPKPVNDRLRETVRRYREVTGV
jgi:uncharacterized protein (DUF1778 family)